MADMTWEFENGDRITLADNKIVAIDDVLRLSKLNAALDNWDFNGTYYESTAILDPRLAGAVKSIYGFYADKDDNGGSVSFRLSGDGGATWWGWNGGAWVSGGPFASMEDVDANIAAFVIQQERAFTVEVKITPSSDNQTPVIRRVAIFAEMPFGFIEDLERSLSSYLKSKVRVQLRYGEKFNAPASSVTVPGSATIHQPIGVYNLDADPGKLNFASLAGRVVNFAFPQNGRVLIEYSGQIPVHIETDEDYQIADRLAIVLRTPTITEARVMRDDGEAVEPLLGGRDLGWGTRPFAMVRQHRIWFDGSVIFSCFATQPEGGKRESAAMADAVDAAFEEARHKKDFLVLSRACGEHFQILDKTPVTVADSVREKVFERRVSVDMAGKSWIGEGELKQLVEEVVITTETLE
jgi:hypothetical protein